MVAIPCVVKESLTMAQAGFVEHLLDPRLKIRLRASPKSKVEHLLVPKIMVILRYEQVVKYWTMLNINYSKQKSEALLQLLQHTEESLVLASQHSYFNYVDKSNKMMKIPIKRKNSLPPVPRKFRPPVPLFLK